MNTPITIERCSTVLLRLAVLGVGLAVLGICGLLLPELRHVGKEFPDYAFAVYVVLATLYLTTIPYYLGLFKAWKLLGLIDAGRAFTVPAAAALRFIAWCVASIGILYGLSLPWFYVWADRDDAPGLMVIGLVFTAVPTIVAVCVAVLQRLLHEAIVIKSDNDLTV